MEKTNKDFARDYLKRGLSVIPLNKKIPFLDSWKEFQKRLPTEEEVDTWWTEWPNANIGLVTGSISKIVVVDVDGGMVPDFVDTPHCQTSPGKFHFYFAYPEFFIPNSAKKIASNIDIRGDGGYVVAPPSQHFDKDSGKPDYRYEWELSLDDVQLAPLPKWVIDEINSEDKKPVNEIVQGSSQGSRNVDATSLVGKLLSKFSEYEWEDFCWPLIEGWNDKNNPPLNFKELRTVFRSIASRESSKNITSDLIHIPNAIEFMNQDFGEIDWVVKNLIPVGGKAVIVAKRESYKTWEALYIAERVSHGDMLWDTLETQKGKVLYITNDDPTKSFQKRLANFSFDENFFIYYPSLPVFTIEGDGKSFKSVEDLVEKEQISLVIIDILRNVHNKDSNTDKDAKMVLAKLDELRLANPQLSFIFVIHPSKENPFEKNYKKRNAEEAVGSYYWEAAVDTVISLIKTSDGELTDTVKIEVTKNKQSDKKIKPFIGIRRKNDGPIEFINEEFIPDKTKLDDAVEAIPVFVKEHKGTGRNDILEYLVNGEICAKRTAEDALTVCQQKGLIKHTSSRPHAYFIPDDFPQTATLYKEHGIAESEQVGQLPIIVGEEDEE